MCVLDFLVCATVNMTILVLNVAEGSKNVTIKRYHAKVTSFEKSW